MDAPIFCSHEDVPGITALVSRLRSAAECAADTAGPGDWRSISNDRNKWPTHSTSWTGSAAGEDVRFNFHAERSAAPNFWSHRKLVNHVEITVQTSSPFFRSFSFRAPVRDEDLDSVPPRPEVADLVRHMAGTADALEAGAAAIAADPLSVHGGMPGSHVSTRTAGSTAFQPWDARRLHAAALLRERLSGSQLRGRLEITAPTPWSSGKAMSAQEEFSSAPSHVFDQRIADAVCAGLPPVVCLSKEEDTHPPRWTMSALRLGPIDFAEPDPTRIAAAIRSFPEGSSAALDVLLAR